MTFASITKTALTVTAVTIGFSMFSADAQAKWVWDWRTGNWTWIDIKPAPSVNDPFRPIVDPGSYHFVNRYESDAYGRTWHVTGPAWTSLGVPHGNLKRVLIGNAGGPGAEIFTPYSGRVGTQPSIRGPREHSFRAPTTGRGADRRFRFRNSNGGRSARDQFRNGFGR